MKAFLFAAGLGTRLHPLTKNKPKALVEFMGKPLLAHNIEKLIDSGVEEIIINVHHHAAQIYQFLNENQFNIPIQISDESELILETGGGLLYAKTLLKSKEPIILYNVDVISSIDLKALIHFHKQKNALASLAIKNRKSSRKLLFNKANRLLGWENNKTNEKILYEDVSLLYGYAFSGIHVINYELIELIELKGKFSITQAYLDLCKDQYIQGYLHQEDWFDIGSLEKLKLAEQFYQNRKT